MIESEVETWTGLCTQLPIYGATLLRFDGRLDAGRVLIWLNGTVQDARPDRQARSLRVEPPVLCVPPKGVVSTQERAKKSANSETRVAHSLKIRLGLLMSLGELPKYQEECCAQRYY